MNRSVRGKVRRILSSSRNQDYEDVCQEIWLTLWKVGQNYWNPRGVNLVAKQVTLKWIERAGRSPSGFSIIDKIDGDDWQEPYHEMSHLCPDIAKITAKLLLLPAEQRAVFGFRYRLDGHEELTFNEIGKRLKISTGQAAYLFCKARKNLQELLNPLEKQTCGRL
jgi:DNA-directed RNA polymerase specialized sigma24 family protein